jgi:hypothetical protein
MLPAIAGSAKQVRIAIDESTRDSISRARRIWVTWDKGKLEDTDIDHGIC